VVRLKPRPLYPWGKSPVPTEQESGWYPKTGLDEVMKRKILPLSGLKLRPFGRPARRQSLSRLQTTRSHVSKESTLHSHCRANLKPHTLPSECEAMFHAHTKQRGAVTQRLIFFLSSRHSLHNYVCMNEYTD
jgi:hypothetical protein